VAKPTISELARAAGVSPTTVSHAFSGRRHVDPETRERIHALAREIGYHPSALAQRLRSGRTGTIALGSSMPFAVAAGPSRLGFLMEIAASGAMSAFTRDIALCLIPPQPSEKNLNQMAFDGVILVEPAADDPLVRHFETRQTPVVAIGRMPGREDIPYLDLHSGATTRLLLEHMREQGSHDIALLTGKGARNSYLETLAAYRDDAARAGTVPRILVLEEAGGEDLAYDAVPALMRQHPGIDGLLVPVDAFASGAVRALTGLGKRVPEDVRVATRYDGIRAKLADPPLTAVNLHLSELAELAVDLLLDHIEGRAEPIATPFPQIIARASTRGPVR
jgi:DNA-binding LacI/PurR family transcriptional regulator